MTGAKTPDISFLGDSEFERLKTLMAKLRSPGGCPWDREQSFETIAPYTIEEAYEVREAITQGDMHALKEELGDLLFQVIFHAQMADEAGAFNLESVCDHLTQKMVRRHPHVFNDGDDRSSSEQVIAWEDMKAKERQDKKSDSVLTDVALALPALMRAEKLQKRAARVGFDWPSLDGVLEKITEEAQEVAEAAEGGDPDDIEDEIGDLLFAVTNLARRLKVDPEKALRRTNDKFTRRFQYIERTARSRRQSLLDMDLDEMETLWQAAKQKP